VATKNDSPAGKRICEGNLAAAGCAILLAACGATAPTATPQVTRDPSLAYEAVVATDELDLTTALSGEDVPCGPALLITGTPTNSAGCRSASVTARDAAQKFLDDVSKLTVPSADKQGDGQRRQGLALYISGSNLQIKAIDAISAGHPASIPSPVHDELVTATQQVTTGGTQLIEASIATPRPRRCESPAPPSLKWAAPSLGSGSPKLKGARPF
jgi:hypothetical protein